MSPELAHHSKRTRKCPNHWKGPLAERLWRRVQKGSPDECWPWLGQSHIRHGKRYGHLSQGGARKKNVKVHRVAYESSFGQIPTGLCVCHRCDNPICCNPSHLFLGTHQDNMADMVAKGRAKGLRGEKNSNAILTAAQAAEIRATPRGSSATKLGSLYGISKHHVRAVRSGRCWKDIP